MRFALMSEPQQGMSYEEILALVHTAEQAGFESYFRSDHYSSFPGEAGLPTTGAAAELQQVCFTGAWVSAIASGNSSVRLSPGDIDEALLTVLSPLSKDEADAVQSTSFERAAALRIGLLDGLHACLR